MSALCPLQEAQTLQSSKSGSLHAAVHQKRRPGSGGHAGVRQRRRKTAAAWWYFRETPILQELTLLRRQSAEIILDAIERHPGAAGGSPGHHSDGDGEGRGHRRGDHEGSQRHRRVLRGPARRPVFKPVDVLYTGEEYRRGGVLSGSSEKTRLRPGDR